jgi:hypothetical protein
MKQAHNYLRDKYQWYDRWHTFPFSSQLHWLIFCVLTVIVTSVLLSLFAYYDPSLHTASYAKNTRGGTNSVYSPDYKLVTFKPGVSESDQKQILSKYYLVWNPYITGTTIVPVRIPRGSYPQAFIRRLKQREELYIQSAEICPVDTAQKIEYQLQQSGQLSRSQLQRLK